MFKGQRLPQEDGVALALCHVDGLYRTALRLTRNPSDAEDLVQEAFLRGYRYLRRLSDADACKAVLYTIMLNVWRKEWRHAQRELPVLELQRPWGESDPEAAVVSKTFLAAVDRALQQLPPELRVAVLLADIEGFTYQEMADILHCPLGTVRSRLHRARRWLARALAVFAEPASARERSA